MNAKLIFGSLLGIIAPTLTAFSDESAMGWMWVEYPWAYSSANESWSYMKPQEGELWFYDFKAEAWSSKHEAKDCEAPGYVRPTIDSMIGKMIYVDNDWAGEAFVLNKDETGYSVRRITFGSGRPVVKEEDYPVTTAYTYQIQFSAPDPDPRNEHFKLSMGDCGRFTLYLNNIRIYCSLDQSKIGRAL